MTTRLTPEREQDIRDRLAARTAGEWYVARVGTDYDGRWSVYLREPNKRWDRPIIDVPRRSDCDLIANAPADLAALLAEVERLRAWRDYALHLERVLADLRVVAADLRVEWENDYHADLDKRLRALDGDAPGYDTRCDAFRDFTAARPDTARAALAAAEGEG